MTSDATVAFLGAGNMARSLAGGLLDGDWPAARITAADPDPQARAAMAALDGGTRLSVHERNEAAVAGADVVVLAVKPQVAEPVLKALRSRLERERPLLVSIAAGLELATLAAWGGSGAWVRCMPNTPALIGAGTTALVPGPGVTEGQRALADAILGAVGTTLWLEDEGDLDAVTALSGSGPAYVFRLLEALVDGAEALGLDRDRATALALGTVRGAALMAAHGSDAPARLRERVTSPGGTTEAALETLEAGAFGALIARALRAAAARSRALAEAARPASDARTPDAPSEGD